MEKTNMPSQWDALAEQPERDRQPEREQPVKRLRYVGQNGEPSRQAKTVYNKIWYEKNRERLSAARKAHRLANPDYYRARHKRYQEANREKESARGKAYYRKNREKWKIRAEANRERLRPYHKKIARRWHLKNKYGLSLDQFDKLLEAQNRKCAICETENLGRIAVDHCHISGHVRGILCERASAMKYLSKELIFNGQ